MKIFYSVNDIFNKYPSYEIATSYDGSHTLKRKAFHTLKRLGIKVRDFCNLQFIF